MGDPVNTARTARANLAQGLSALQAPGVPPALVEAAQPIANAMAALHELETSHGGAAQAAPFALSEVRRALAMLQADESGHPAVGQAMEAVAGSLGLVHSLAAAPGGQGANAAAQPTPARAPVQHAGHGPAQAPFPNPGGPAFPAAPAPEPRAQPQAATRPQAPAGNPGPPPAAQGRTAAPMQRPVPRADAGPPIRVTAELGVHSPTNFYRGLSGNDVVDSGGLFVATYQVPKLGREVLLHIVLPGGFEFDASAIVRWIREAPISSTSPGDAPPGFGAAFTEISGEARRLVQRYVQNREPLFHDDL